MGWLSRLSTTDRKISHIHNLLVRSFSNVRNDTQNIFQWLNYLYKQNQQQQHKIRQLELELSYMPKNPEDVKRIIDNYYSFDSILERIKMLNEKMDTLSIKPQAQQPLPKSSEIYEIEKRILTLEEQRKATIREKVVQRVSKNSKEYVKSLILSYIRKYGQISGLQLKEMIVQDQGLCSKSSFYRLLEELETLQDIGTAKQGKQKYYLFKQVKQS